MLRVLRTLSVALLLSAVTVSCAEESRRFRVTLSHTVTAQPISGRLLVFLNSQGADRPIENLDWFHPEPFCAVEVKNLAPGESVILDDKSDCFPSPLSMWPAKKCRVQAVLDQDFYFAEPARGPGNVFSDAIDVELDADSAETLSLELTHVVPAPEYVDNDNIRFVQLRSPLLSTHHQREVIDRAAVILPPSYHTSPERRYPVFYQVSGFGDALAGAAQRALLENRKKSASTDGIEFIVVALTGECKWGHHVYANSAINGPRGDALVQEMIPEIDATFRTITDSRARFIGGHSSGGWSSLWLQVQYPETFGGVWSSSPDPVDFRDWQGTDLYAVPPQSVFIDSKGQRRPIARMGPRIALYYDSFNHMDDVLGRGGQLRSFDAVFSPLNDQGQPAHCWDRKTGIVDPAIAEHWKKYDISLILEQNWETLRDKLAGKIHIVMGDLDTFYLNGATRQLDQRLKALGSDAQIEFVPRANHFETYGRMEQKRSLEIREVFSRSYEADGTAKTASKSQ